MRNSFKEAYHDHSNLSPLFRLRRRPGGGRHHPLRAQSRPGRRGLASGGPDAGVSRLGRNPHRLARPVDRSGGDGRLPRGRKRHPHHPIRHRPAHSDRQPAALAIRHGGARHRCRAATMADRRAALPRARRDLPHSLRCGKTAGPLRLAGRRWRHRHRPARSGRRPRLCASSARYRWPRQGMERVRHLWISSSLSRPAS